MTPVFGSVFTAFGDSNLAGQLIVILLIAFSVLAWTVMLGKYHELKKMRDLNTRYERYLAQLGTIRAAQKDYPGAYASLTREAIEAWGRTEGGSSELRIGMVENAIQRSVGECVMGYEGKMVWLASIVTGAPFFGLLGTVWGVMDAFGAIATEQTATIQMLAPGVSGALLTTVAGLLVAIPSVFGYNYLLSQTKIMVTELENFASILADRFELEERAGEGRAR